MDAGGEVVYAVKQNGDILVWDVRRQAQELRTISLSNVYDTQIVAHTEAATVADLGGSFVSGMDVVEASRQVSPHALLQSARRSLGLGLASARLSPSNPNRLVFQTADGAMGHVDLTTQAVSPLRAPVADCDDVDE
jgi:hypothetical protein